MKRGNNAPIKDFLLDKRLIVGECWEWTRFRNPLGYGQLTYKYKRWLVHRLAYKVFVGPIPEGLYVCHHCDNPACFNPKHLFLGNDLDNVRDMIRKGRAVPTERKVGEASGMAKLTEDQVRRMHELRRTHTVKAIADQFGINEGHASRILRGLRWPHLASGHIRVSSKAQPDLEGA